MRASLTTPRGYQVAISEFTVACNALVTVGVMCV
jgi:hypothetical protein